VSCAESPARDSGLGTRAAFRAARSPNGRELAEAEAARARSAVASWIERQDALDRKRNHFLRDFRTKHGFDRAKYTTEQQAQFDDGLARINADEDRLRTEVAQLLAS
jgi:hypothetical protein